ncbi:MAG: sigma factor-like helix-turn-helix DNA-binding protein [Planctomycetota bacterium]
MKQHEDIWLRASLHARRFLSRYDDVFTRSERDDLVQESTVAAWQWVDDAREPDRLAAAVRTIARRKRSQALRLSVRQRQELIEASLLRMAEGHAAIRVAGRRVSRDWLAARLAAAIQRLRPIDRTILMSWQEGFCCAEIAARMQLTEDSVKVRMYRARRRLRMEIEDAVRTADRLDGFRDDA